MQPGAKVWVRAGRLGAALVLLVLLSLLMFGLAVWTVSSEPRESAGHLLAPLGVSMETVLFDLEILVGAVLLWLAGLTALAALQTAVSIQVLGRPRPDSREMGWAPARA